MDALTQMTLALMGNPPGHEPAPPPPEGAVQTALAPRLETGPGVYQAGDDPIRELAAQIHQAGSPLEWAMALAGGPRGLKLGPMKTPSWGGAAHHEILDNNNPIGYVQINSNNPRKLFVESIGADSKLADPNYVPPDRLDATSNSIGPGSLRTLIPQIKEQYPEAEKIGGYRVTGARPKSAEAWLQLRPPNSEQNLEDAASDAMKRWRRESIKFRDARFDNADQMQANVGRIPDISRVLNAPPGSGNNTMSNPAVGEMTARRNAMKEGRPNWSELSPTEKEFYRDQATYEGATPGDMGIPQTQLNAVRNRWLGAQQSAMRREANNSTQSFIDRYNDAMEALLRGQK